MGNCLTSTRTAPVNVKPKREPTAGIGNGRRRINLGDLPEDVLRRIFSKLPVEEVVRTSVLSSQWRFLWTGCPKLSFDSRAMCRCWEEEEQDTQMFVDRVNAILRQHSSKGVEGLERIPARLQQAVTTVLLNGIPEVQRLTLNFAVEQGKPQWMLGSTHMFSRLRHIQLLVMLYCRDNDKLLCLLSFLRVAPAIEKLEVHLEDFRLVWFAKRKSFKQEVPSCEYKHLKSVYVSGFLAGSDQVEFITHVVENAPALEVLVIDTDLRVRPFCRGMISPAHRRAALDTVRGSLRGKLLPSVKLLLR